jgi:multidrug efflux system membrane fusion protein
MKRRCHHFAVAALMLCSAACTSNSNGTALPPTAAVPVTVARAVKRDVPVQIRAIGNVEAFSTVALTPQVEGQLAEVHFQEGQWVHKDDLLFTIDARPFEAVVRQAEANLHRNRAELGNAEVDAKRKGSLAAQGFVSSEENDAAQTRAASLRAAVKACEAAIENAKLQLQYCFIRSPIDGRIGKLMVNVGNVVRKNETQLAVINQVRPVYVAFSVRDQDLNEVRRHAADGKLAVEAFLGKDGEAVRGELTFINNSVDAATGTVLLKGQFSNDDERLWPGQFVDVRLTLSVQPEAVVVPMTAVLTGQQGKYVFVVKPDSTVEARPVQVGYDLGNELSIRDGVAADEAVVVDGQIRLAPGTKVEVRDNSKTPSPGHRS